MFGELSEGIAGGGTFRAAQERHDKDCLRDV